MNILEKEAEKLGFTGRIWKSRTTGWYANDCWLAMTLPEATQQLRLILTTIERKEQNEMGLWVNR